MADRLKWWIVLTVLTKFALTRKVAPERHLMELDMIEIDWINTVPLSAREMARLNELYQGLGGKDDAVTTAAVAAAIKDERSLILVARDSEKEIDWKKEIVGIGTLAFCHTIPGPKGHIEHVSVHLSASQKGVASAIVRALLEEARRQNLKRVDLTSNPNRPGTRILYTGLGFEVRETLNYRHYLGRKPTKTGPQEL